uniref:HTH_48 domain-containing protein n=1 Tax=Anopheles dirus TaxID=7168 RepID=A0A182NVK1_9DIPT
MGKEDFRVLIKHYFLRQKTISQTRRSLMKYYGNTAPSLAMIHKWYGVFRSGRSSTSESPRTGRPVEVSSPGMVDKIQRLIDQNQYMTVRQIAQATGISTGAVVSITHRHLNLRKLYDDRWIPRDNLCRHAPKKEAKLQIKKEPPYVKEEPDYEEQHVITIEKLEDVEVLEEEIFEIEELVEESEEL